MSRTSAEHIERFARRVLEREGASLEARERGLLTSGLPPSLEGVFRSDPALLVFEDTRSRRAEGDLVAPGSYAMDRLIALARARGAACRVFLPALHAEREAALLAQLGAEGRPPVREYLPRYRFEYQLSCEADFPFEEFIRVEVDPLRGTAGPAPDHDPEGASEPDPRFRLPPSRALRSAYEASRRAAAEAAGRVAERAIRNARRVFDRERENVERYYRQLIAEERRASETRGNRGNGSEDRVRTLKREWERRVKEETARLSPTVRGRLSSVLILCAPGLSVRRGGEAASACVDLYRGEIAGPRRPAKRVARRTGSV
jgi:hypothetical protein